MTDSKRSQAEGEILKIYDGSRPLDEDLYETSNVNHVAWSLVVVLAFVVVWLCIALVNAENQRYALMTNKCPDPVFKGGIDRHCLVLVRSRDHWWEHLWYGVSHVRAPRPDEK